MFDDSSKWYMGLSEREKNINCQASWRGPFFVHLLHSHIFHQWKVGLRDCGTTHLHVSLLLLQSRWRPRSWEPHWAHTHPHSKRIYQWPDQVVLPRRQRKAGMFLLHGIATYTATTLHIQSLFIFLLTLGAGDRPQGRLRTRCWSRLQKMKGYKRAEKRNSTTP